MWAHTFLAATHVFAIPLLRTAVGMAMGAAPTAARGIVASIVTIASVTASVLMHLSETKHGLDPGPRWRSLSGVLLDIDRAAAVTTALCFAWWWVTSPRRGWEPLLWLGLGLVCSWVGEQTTRVPLYVSVHTVWHAYAFHAMHLVLQSYSAAENVRH